MTTYEPKERGGREIRPGQPGGAGAVFGNKFLAALVLESVSHVEDEEINPPPNPVAPRAFHPRALLAMLTYCYSIGVYGSADVEEMMYADADFRVLCGMEYPDWKRLKRFRRENHDTLRRTLAETLTNLWRTGVEAGRKVTSVPGESSNGLPDLSNQAQFANEAQACIERAMFIDQLAVE